MAILTDIVKIEIKLDECPTIQYTEADSVKSFRVAGRSFGQYCAKRVDKDSLGLIPISSWKDAATDCKTYIRSVIPKNCQEFLVYCHELGHCKSKQPASEPSFGFFGGDWCNGRLICEYNAWVWGIRYFKRLGFKLSEQHEKIVKYSLESYFKSARDKFFAKTLSDKFEKWCGIATSVPEPQPKKPFPTVSFGNPCKTSWDTVKIDDGPLPWFTWTDAKAKPKPVKEKPKNWKPWHDLKAQQMKKSWKHQR